jgi:hypothetical protein
VTGATAAARAAAHTVVPALARGAGADSQLAELERPAQVRLGRASAGNAPNRDGGTA